MTHLVLAMFLNFTGMACLAVGMERHYRRVWGGVPPRGALTCYRRRGWALLISALLPCLSGWGPSIGIVVWTGLLTVSLPAVAIPLATLQD